MAMRRDIGICDRIRRERRPGIVRCDVFEGKMTVVEVARAFGLADEGAVYRSVESVEADAIATRVLRASLAYGSEIMSGFGAAGLWRQFMAQFDGQNVEFATNAGAQADTWTSATRATFDMGVIVTGVSKAGCLWIEEED